MESADSAFSACLVNIGQYIDRADGVEVRIGELDTLKRQSIALPRGSEDQNWNAVSQ